MKNKQHYDLLIVCLNMSKIVLASEEPNLFELFRAPKIFEAKPQ